MLLMRAFSLKGHAGALIDKNAHHTLTQNIMKSAPKKW
jgi:hypothetical protein